MITLFHDVTDPASAIAVRRYTRLAREGLDISFEGFEAVGVDVAVPADLGLLARVDDLAETAAEEGLVLRRPTVLPPTGLAHVLLAHAEQTPRSHVVREAVYAAYWADGRDVADQSVLVDVATAAGLDVTTVTELLADRVALADRRRRMAAHRRTGVGGVPVVLASRTLVPALMDERSVRELAASV